MLWGVMLWVVVLCGVVLCEVILHRNHAPSPHTHYNIHTIYMPQLNPPPPCVHVLSTSNHQALQDLQAAKREQTTLKGQVSTYRSQLNALEETAQQAQRQLTALQSQHQREQQRHEEIYKRLQRVMVLNKGGKKTGVVSAGSVAAAARELRPVELVAVFDRQQQELEVWFLEWLYTHGCLGV